MKTAEEALEELGRVSAADRAWILRALSSAAKARLRLLTVTLQEHPSDSGARAPGMDTAVDLSRLVPRLAAEPAWILAVLLRARPGPWTAQLLVRLAADKRLEVTQLRASLPRLSPKMAEALARALSAQLSVAEDVPETSFEETFERARSRARRWRRLVEVGT